MTLPNADRLELSDLVHRYAAYVDARQFDDVARLFTSTAEFALPKPPDRLTPVVRYHGRDGVLAAMAPLAGITRTHHGIVGEVYSDGPDGNATGSIVGVAHHWTTKGHEISDVVWYLRYADEYRRTTDGWRISLRALTIDAIATSSAGYVREALR